MLAWINGVMVQGSPEEIERYRRISTTENKYGSPYKMVDDVPEHVKNYGKNDMLYKLDGRLYKVRSWF